MWLSLNPGIGDFYGWGLRCCRAEPLSNARFAQIDVLQAVTRAFSANRRFRCGALLPLRIDAGE
jgi:hypothetical protein